MRGKRNARRRRSRMVLLSAGLSFLLLQGAVALLPAHKCPAPFDTRGLWDVAPLEYSIVHWQMRHLLESSDQDVIFFGDSSCLMGVKPRVVQDATGLKTSNYGMLGYLGTKGHALLFRLFLERHTAPRLAVYYVCAYPLEASQKDIDDAGMLRALQEWQCGAIGEGQVWRLADRKLAEHVQALCDKLL